MSVRIRAASRARRLAALSLGLAALVLVPTVASIGQTEAAWVNSEHASTTVQVPTVTITKGACTRTGGILPAEPTTATFAWSYPPASATVAQPSSVTYVVRNSAGTAIIGPTTVTGTPPAVSSFSFTINTQPVGTYTVTVTPVRSTWATGSTASWTGQSITYTAVISQNALTLRYFSSCA